MNKKLSDLYGLQLLKELIWQDKVTSFYNPSSELPASPDFKDRYIASASGNGWLENKIYEYNGDEWFEIEPKIGTITLILDEGQKYYYFNGSAWQRLETLLDHELLDNAIPATEIDLGHVKIGDGILVDADGKISLDPEMNINAAYFETFTGSSATVSHNLNIPHILVQVYDSSDKMVKPDNIEIIDDNTILVEFSESLTFTVVVMEIGAKPNTILSLIKFKGRWTSLSGSLDTPASTYHDNKFWVLLEDADIVENEEPGVSDKWITIYDGIQDTLSEMSFATFSETYTNVTSVNINHNLGVPQIIVQTYDQNGKMVKPKNVQIIDDNEVFIEFDKIITFTVVITEAGGRPNSILSYINFKGSWSGLTGSLNVPASTYHDNKFWVLMNNIADVTTQEPGVSSVWVSSYSMVSDAFSSATIQELSNVLITSPSNNQVLTYEDGNWINKNNTDLSDYYTKTEIDTNHYTKTEIDNSNFVDSYTVGTTFPIVQSIVRCTQAEYDAIVEPDDNTLYIIEEV